MDKKVTAIVATFDGPLDCLAWSLTSLLLRSQDLVDEIIVSINGGDDRNGGDTSVQDAKQRMCEDLADMGHPVKVVRAWSRIGFSQPFDMAIPLAKNPYYLVMHDDTLIQTSKWAEEARAFFEDEGAGVMTVQPLQDFPMTYYTGGILEFPLTNTPFVLVKSDKVFQKWQEYYIQHQYVPSDAVDYNAFMTHHGKHRNLAYDMKVEGGINWGGHDDTCGRGHSPFNDGSGREYYQVPESGDPVSITKMPTGSWVFYDMQCQGGIRYFSKDTVYHFMQREVPVCHRAIDLLRFERELKNHQPLWDFYIKYCPHKRDVVLEWPARVCNITQQAPPDPVTGLKAVVCVGVYRRTYTIQYWGAIWPKLNKANAEFVLIHNYDGNEPAPDLRAVHEAAKPDYYITRANTGFGTGMLQDIFEMRNMEDLPVPCDWDVLIWFTDDNIPSSPDLIPRTLEKFKDPEVMLVGHFCQPYNVRTTALAIRKSFIPKLVLHGSPCIPRRHGGYLEHEHRSITTQVIEAGYKVAHFNPWPLEVIYDPERFRCPEYDKVIQALADAQFDLP